MPKRAVAAKVVALVTGTARERGASERMAKKVAEAERLMRKGTEYCQIQRSLNQLRREKRNFWLRVECGCGFGEDFRASSQRSAPRRMIAFVAPHIKPTAIIFSIFGFALFTFKLPGSASRHTPNQLNDVVLYPELPTVVFYFWSIDGSLLMGCITWADLKWSLLALWFVVEMDYKVDLSS
ncbi:hypothetical protein SESBI_03408 [Sesbania bispinosa]|nr:hypothetical protein SESBI_03408 [Sesbania bispinosa]